MLSEDCAQCGTTNQRGSREPKSWGAPGKMHVLSFSCDNCGAEGELSTHSKAGIVGKNGAYFNESTDD